MSVPPHIKDAEIFEVAATMARSGLPRKFTRNVINAALEFTAIHELMLLWRDEKDEQERDEIVADLQELIDDLQIHKPEKKPYINFNDLEMIATDIMGFKDRLRKIVDDAGGVTSLANKTGIPQPSLSRFFNTASMPQRATLLKIADALNLSEIDISTEWTR